MSNKSGNAIRRATARALSFAAIPYLLVGALLVAAVIVVGENVALHIGAIEAWIEALGAWSGLVFVTLFVLLTSILLPASLFSLIAGALFGIAWGMLLVVASNLLAAALQWALAKHMLKERINRMLATRPSLATIQRAVLLSELRLQVLLRLTPVNPATVSYVLGAAGVGFRGFMLGCLALIPHLLIEVWFGSAGKRVIQLAGHAAQPERVHDFAMIAGLAVAIIAMVALARAARQAFVSAAADARLRDDPSGPS